MIESGYVRQFTATMMARFHRRSLGQCDPSQHVDRLRGNNVKGDPFLGADGSPRKSLSADLQRYRSTGRIPDERSDGDLSFSGVAPLEDFAYAIAAAILLPSLWMLMEGRR